MKHFYLFFLVISTSIFSQELQLKDIMKGDGFIGHQPENHRWSIDGSTVYFDWNPNNEKGNKTYFWKSGMKSPEVLKNELLYLSEIDFKNQKEFNDVYFIKNKVLYSYSKNTKQTRKVYHSTSGISSLKRSNNPDVIYFQQEGNLFQLNVGKTALIQLTNFKLGKEKSKKDEEESNFLTDQQKELFQFVNDQNDKKEWNNARAKADVEFFPKEYYYDKSSIEQIQASPNGSFVTFRQSNYVSQTNTKVEHFISADGYTKNKDARSKVSLSNNRLHKFGIYNTKKDSIYFVSFSNLSSITDKPKYYQDYEKLKKLENVVREVVMQSPVYNKDGSIAVMEMRSVDNKDRWIVKLDLEKGTITELEHQHDEAWINGPGIPGSSFGRGVLGFLSDNETIYFQSEATGYSHLYFINTKNKKKTQLTKGNWEVRNVEYSKDGKTFYISTNTTHPGNLEFYKLDIASKKTTEILIQDGAHEVELSPDEKTLLVRYSYKNKPWELFTAINKSNSTLKQITYSTTKEFNAYNWQKPEVISFKAQDGTNIYSRVYHPKKEVKNNAAVIFVHGAGYLQNAHNFWSTYHREYMFHNLLTDLGYTVLDIDYRGSDGYGRDVRTGIYRHMGGLDLADQLDGKKYIVDNLNIDTNRVGIYGGSYGGFITLMALLTKPGEFKAGAALRSVTDWAHYNHGYTSNILNYPETDPEAYKKSSPIYFADNLQDKLVMLHGMVDDNVQFQDIVRMSQRFIELGKKDWNLAVYPVEAHGFRETYSWIDEYRRILELFNQNLLKK